MTQTQSFRFYFVKYAGKNKAFVLTSLSIKCICEDILGHSIVKLSFLFWDRGWNGTHD